MTIPTLAFGLDKQSDLTLQKQLQQAVVAGILSKKFLPGERMPSSRQLAHDLGISRITVTLAYSELVALDYLKAKGRSGYFISQNLPDHPHLEPAGLKDSNGSGKAKTSGKPFVDWQAALGTKHTSRKRPWRPANWRDYDYPFIYGQVDSRLFDYRNWRRCAIEALGKRDLEAVIANNYDETDDPELVEYILSKALPKRGIYAKKTEILITLGAQNALWIAAQILLNPERRAVVENPCYTGLRDVIDAVNCETDCVNIDAEGLPPEKLPQNCDVVFATVSHQCPSSVTMPLARRKALLEKAKADNFIIIEDDYEFELSAQSRPNPALKALDETGHVVYIGSFSKSLFPSLRLGYIVASKAFIDEARKLRGILLRHPPGHPQRTAAYFLSLGYYDRQLNRISQAFKRRRSSMLAAIEKYSLCHASDPAVSGSSFWMKTNRKIDTELLATKLRDENVLIEPGANFFAEPDKNRHYYRLAYSSISAAKIEAGIAKIAKAIAAY